MLFFWMTFGWNLNHSIFFFKFFYLAMSFYPFSPVSFPPAGRHVAGRSRLLLPFEFESSEETASSGGKKPENSSVFSLNFYGVKSEGLYVRKNMYKHSNFNTWLTNSVTSCIKRGHLRKGPFLPALPFALSPLACRAAMQSLCLGFQGLQSVWGRGHAGPVSRPV